MRLEVQDCPYINVNGRSNALWRTLIVDFAGERAAPEEDWLFIETWYDRIGWQLELPDLISKGTWETVNFESAAEMNTKMTTHYLDLKSKTPAFIDYVQKSSVTEIIKDSMMAPQLPKRYGEYVCRIRRACAYRSLFVTGKGFMGLAPWNVQEGDIVCVLRGGKTPFLLRLPPTACIYKIVGEAYVHGIMGGEAVVNNEQGNNWIVFNLD